MSEAWASAASVLMSANAAAAAHQTHQFSNAAAHHYNDYGVVGGGVPTTTTATAAQQQQQQQHAHAAAAAAAAAAAGAPAAPHPQQQQQAAPRLPAPATAVNVFDLTAEQMREGFALLVQEQPLVANDVIGRVLGGINAFAYADASTALPVAEPAAATAAQTHPQAQPQPPEVSGGGANGEDNEMTRQLEESLQQQLLQQRQQRELQHQLEQQQKVRGDDDGGGGGPKKRRSTSAPRTKKRSRAPPAEVGGSPLATIPATNAPKSTTGGGKRANSWMQRYEDLKRFHAEHGHCRVPVTYPPNLPLGRWCDNQRQAHRRYVKEGPSASWLTPERIKLLEDLSFDWTMARFEFRDWDVWYGELVEFRERHGHTRVTCSGENSRLGGWVQSQRYNYLRKLEGGKSHITQERIDKLNAIGFEWKIKDAPVEWNERLKQLKAFHAEHGHWNVPRHLKEKDHPDHALGMWLYYQRMQYKFRKEGKKSLITDERIATLSLLGGFDWEIKSSTGRQYWDDRYEELKAYKEKFGTCHVKDSNREGKFEYRYLSKWYFRQSTQYKKHLAGEENTLTPERLAKLEALDFHHAVFGPRKGRAGNGKLREAERAEREKQMEEEKKRRAEAVAAAKAKRLEKRKIREALRRDIEAKKAAEKKLDKESEEYAVEVEEVMEVTDEAEQEANEGNDKKSMERELRNGTPARGKKRRRGRPRKVTEVLYDI